MTNEQPERRRFAHEWRECPHCKAPQGLMLTYDKFARMTTGVAVCLECRQRVPYRIPDGASQGGKRATSKRRRRKFWF